ncbi:putative proteasome-type protease [Rubricella aquisinus]|uniref:Putative proteasome-type protease n=1 Tax=Rubricella aquisinus TaxID=2028108 RepID=A0A840X206_9RHOB|nr:peptidase [Rubricella aquisinus]MBB5514707.1 putative proteasome-type protease [Rubricella aquisinus]
MTYCLALKLDEGLICLSDTRTNAGVDNISKYKKMFTWNVPGERVICMMTAGNLAVTQAVMSLLQENIDNPKEGIDTLYTAPSMFRVAEIVADAMRVVMGQYGAGLAAAGESAASTIIVAGQRVGGRQRLFLVYSAGNFIEAGDDTPFFQIGENKYGKPILDRVIEPATPLATGIVAALLSMDSTLRSNLSVGMPLDLAVMEADTFQFDQQRRIDENDAGYRNLSNAWSEAIRASFDDMVKFSV